MQMLWKLTAPCACAEEEPAIFDRYNIINEQELLEAGDQLVAYLAQHAQATPRGRRPHKPYKQYLENAG